MNVRAVLAAGVACAVLQSVPAAGQTAAVQAIRDAMIVDVPLVLDKVEPGDGEGLLWVRGDAPADRTFTRFYVKPMQVAMLEVNGAQTLLWRAFPGGLVSAMRSGQLDLVRAPRYFCQAASDRAPAACLVDENADGQFDHAAEAIAERGTKPYHLTVMKASRKLDQPLPYRIAPDDQRPAVTIDLENCARDHDRPRFAARSIDDSNAERFQPFGWMEKDSSLSSCRRSRRLDSVPAGATPPPPGGFVAQLGPFAFTIGEKKNPRFALAGPVDPQALYRIEGNSLVELSVGFTPDQARLVALKKFPYPIMMADDGATIASGTVAKGAAIASVPFHHAYHGRLTQDVMVSNLFGKRSVAAGTVVYGFPAKSSLTFTRNGIPSLPNLGDEDFRQIDLELTWCTAVHRETGPKDKPDPVGRNGWSAACLPYSKLGNHTVLTDLQPAFGISGVSYNASTSSNDGAPPVERDDERGFDKPLRLEYVFEAREGEFIALREEIRFGDEVTSSKPQKIYAPQGTAAITIAGATMALAVDETGNLSVTPAGATVPGTDPKLQWDERAWMRKQMEKMGLRMVEEPAPNAAVEAP
ncbi:hypothetical protein OVA07_18065 [Novosphingobium sp. SL115]|uniref:hypothetical protein n=1 Tax=Novosphingobium sp. SL115 TaxID=2995150 RepID=UPI002273D9DE|nr:hypothetical protein [Novosphingobium sp. SL115]MCY1672911.1 hypothetical protein [Novosphingobium sp. SL115]